MGRLLCYVAGNTARLLDVQYRVLLPSHSADTINLIHSKRVLLRDEVRQAMFFSFIA